MIITKLKIEIEVLKLKLIGSCNDLCEKYPILSHSRVGMFFESKLEIINYELCTIIKCRQEIRSIKKAIKHCKDYKKLIGLEDVLYVIF